MGEIKLQFLKAWVRRDHLTDNICHIDSLVGVEEDEWME